MGSEEKSIQMGDLPMDLRKLESGDRSKLHLPKLVRGAFPRCSCQSQLIVRYLSLDSLPFLGCSSSSTEKASPANVFVFVFPHGCCFGCCFGESGWRARNSERETAIAARDSAGFPRSVDCGAAAMRCRNRHSAVDRPSAVCSRRCRAQSSARLGDVIG